MKKKSVSTLIYYQDKSRKKVRTKIHVHVNKEKRARAVFSILKLLFLFLLGGSVVFGYVKYKPFRVTRVDVLGEGRFVNLEDVRKIAETNVLGKDIIVVNTAGVVEAIAHNYLAAKSVKVTKSYPRTIQVTVTERVPIALLLTKDALLLTKDASLLAKESTSYYFVDAEGFVLGPADKTTTNLPIISYGQKVYVGKFLEENAISYYFELLHALDENSILVSTISAFPKYVQFYTGDSVEALFTVAQSPKSQAKILARMLESFKTEGKKPRKIDLRFDKVIVEFNQEAKGTD